jgi:1-acyl-sn-glycerol-3-phosphate acyltransferase
MARSYSKREAKEYNFWRTLAQNIVIFFFLYPYFKIFYKAKVYGRENIPKDRAFIVAANHMSHLDPTIVSFAAKTPVAYMAKQELFKVPILREIIDILGAFSVDRKKLEISTIKTAKSILKTKWIMAMFPQGTRVEPGKIGKINPGFAYIAKSANAVIVPLSIVGSDKYRFLPFSGNLIVKIGKPLPIPDNLEDTMDLWGRTIAEMTGFEYNKKESITSKEKVVI